MSESGYLLLGLLIVILVISLVAIASNKNVRQKIRFLGVGWDFRSKARPLSNETVSQPNASPVENNDTSSYVDIGVDNRFEDDLGDLAGRDIIKSDSTIETLDSPTGKTGVSLGRKNIFKKKIGDVAGRDIIGDAEQDKS